MFLSPGGVEHVAMSAELCIIRQVLRDPLRLKA